MKKLACLMAAVAMGLVASADALYWQVDTTAASASAAVKDQTFSYATLYAKDGEGVSHAITSVAADAGGKTVQPTLTDLGAYGSSEYSFYVELLNYNSGTTSSVYSQPYASTYNELVSAGYVSTGAMSMPAAFTSDLGAYNGASVPEPTSGLLLLVGGAMLMLRRRRQA